MSVYDTLLAEAAGRPFAAIVGWPVEHSRSPALHGFWLKQHHIDGHYGRLPVKPQRAALEELVAFLRAAATLPCRTRSRSCRCSIASIPSPGGSAR